ncbi:MAG: response regulator [Thermodesulfobacteriota bacterium]
MIADWPRVLILDDDDIIRVNLVAFFEDENFIVRSAISAETGLQLIATEPFHAGVIDIRLPGMDGNGFILRAHEICPAMKFIVHTGSADYVLPETLTAIGLTSRHVFTKPLKDMRLLIQAVKELIETPQLPER